MKPGMRLAEYEIVAPLGAGGMGEVYRARDPRLGRDVAIKVLPAALAEDPEALARFETEARAVAALSHPNILEIYDLGREGDVSYVVAELLDGETLADVVAEGVPPVGKAVDYASQLAAALAAAHAKGIVHRDVKPANVFLTRDGRVKLLDFGLAKSTRLQGGTDASIETLAVSTEPGTVLGTVGYMAPEQVRGEEATAQSDIFALGAVLFETLTGRSPFRRATHAETMTAILREDPPSFAELSKPVPATLEAVVLHCLEKRPQERFQTAQDLAFALQSIAAAAGSGSSAPAAALSTPVRRARPGPAIALALGLALALASGAVLGRWLGPSQATPSEPPRLVQFTFSGRDFDPSASPDGNLIVFASGRDGRSRIWLKQRTGAGAAPLTEGEDSAPRFSPDGQSILFTRVDEQRQPTLQRIALVGGQPRKLVDRAAMGDWSSDGRLTFVRPNARQGDRLMIADADGLNERELLFAPELRLADPRFSPSGDRIAVTRYTSSAGRHRTVIVDVATGQARELPTATVTERVSAAAWNRSGSAVIYSITGSSSGDRGVLPSRVLRHDLATDEHETLLWTTGLFPQQGDAYEVPGFDVLGDDSLVFYAVSAPSSLYEIDLEQTPAGQMGRRITYGDGRDRQPAYSPDGGRVVFTSNRSGNLDLWLYDRRDGSLAQLTDDPADDWDPAWGPDGSLLWSSSRSGQLEIWMADSDGSNARQVTDTRSDAQNPTMSADGQWIVFATRDAAEPGILRIRPDGSDQGLVNPGAGVLPEVSPSGMLVASPIPAGYGGQVRIEFATLDPPEVLEGSIGVDTNPLALDITMGRPRWLREDLLAFLASDEEGRTGVVAQRVTAGQDTINTRRKLAGFYDDGQVETFGISPDRRWIMLGVQISARRIMVAEGMPGLE